jgi:hypothetical protein
MWKRAIHLDKGARESMSTARKIMLQNSTPGQIKKIHALVTALGFDDDLYRAILLNRFNTRSSKELANFQAGQLIEELEKQAVQKGVWKKSAFKKRYEALAGRPGFASGAQLDLIESTWTKVSRMETPELNVKALRGFILKVAGVSDLRFLNKSGAGKVIIALRSMEKRKSILTGEEKNHGK